MAQISRPIATTPARSLGGVDISLFAKDRPLFPVSAVQITLHESRPLPISLRGAERRHPSTKADTLGGLEWVLKLSRLKVANTKLRSIVIS